MRTTVGLAIALAGQADAAPIDLNRIGEAGSGGRFRRGVLGTDGPHRDRASRASVST